MQDRFAVRPMTFVQHIGLAMNPRIPLARADGAAHAADHPPPSAAAGLGGNPRHTLCDVAPSVRRLRVALGIFFSLLFFVSPWLVSAQSRPILLSLPVVCEVGVTCLVQKLFDHDPSTGRRDLRCGTLTTDGHDGVDIRLRTIKDMQMGYAVVASAAGQVLRTRDGEPDVSSRQRTDLKGRDAGNGVVIDHGDGWQTQYSHLRQASITVKPGQRVAAGDRLGLIGMSGNAEFPHLHFTVRHQGKAIDPFVSTAPFDKCSAVAQGPGLWQPAAARALAYAPTVIITAGLASNVPPKSVADRPTPPMLNGPQASLLMWIDMIGARPGDTQEFRITGPGDRVVHEQQTIIEKGGLSWFAYSGKRPPATGWASGRYAGRYVLRRGGKIVAQTDASGVVR